MSGMVCIFCKPAFCHSSQLCHMWTPPKAQLSITTALSLDFLFWAFAWAPGHSWHTCLLNQCGWYKHCHGWLWLVWRYGVDYGAAQHYHQDQWFSTGTAASCLLFLASWSASELKASPESEVPTPNTIIKASIQPTTPQYCNSTFATFPQHSQYINM